MQRVRSVFFRLEDRSIYNASCISDIIFVGFQRKTYMLGAKCTDLFGI